MPLGHYRTSHMCTGYPVHTWGNFASHTYMGIPHELVIVTKKDAKETYIHPSVSIYVHTYMIELNNNSCTQ